MPRALPQDTPVAGNKQYPCAECLKDLQRFLRQDDAEKRPAFFALSSTNISKTDLVPLLMAYPDNKDVVFNSGAFWCQEI